MGADRDVVRRLSDEVFVDGDLSHWDDLVDDGFVDHDPMPGMSDDKKGQRQLAEMVLATFSDRKIEHCRTSRDAPTGGSSRTGS